METVHFVSHVSCEVAELLRKAGFDWSSIGYYNKLGFFHNAIPQHDELKAPSLEVAQKWLREVKGIEVYAHVFYDSHEMLDEWDVYVYEVNHITKHIEDYISSYDIYHTYEQAQEAGIKRALEIILEK